MSHYRILDKIGQGGMAVVYKAEDLTLKRPVAIKFHSKNSSIRSDERKRFLREAQAASSLNHPNICVIYEIDEYEDDTFIVMEYVDGSTLGEWTQRASGDPGSPLLRSYCIAAVDIGIQAASGLAMAHEKGIVHRDVKSDNIMVARDGQVKVMDFGLAKLHDRSKLTKTGSTLGTAAYMSPEQVQGLEVDQRTDIFSFGAVLYEMFAGHVPFQADHESALMYQIVNVEPKPLIEVRVGVDAPLNGIVMRSLIKNREERYQSIREVVLDLERYKQHPDGDSFSRLPQPSEKRKLAAVMFTDMVGYSALTQKNESLALELLDEHQALLRPLFPKHHGREIETVGDAFFAEFTSALDAARCAIEIQEKLHGRNALFEGDKRIRLRIGLHVGDVVVRGNHVHGDAVNIAARIEPIAEPGGICVSEDVDRQIRNKLAKEYRTKKLGQSDLKNIQLPVDIYKIILPWVPVPSPRQRLVRTLKQKNVRRYGLVTILASVLVVYWTIGIDPPRFTESLAVLPLQQVNISSNMEYFSDGVTQDLISRLLRLRFLRVPPFSAVSQYRNREINIRDVGRALKVQAVLWGSVSTQGDVVSINLYLSDTLTQKPVLTLPYTRQVTQTLLILEDITRDVARKFELPFGEVEEREFRSHHPKNMKAYDSYLQGLYHLKKGKEEDNALSLEYFSQALNEDSLYVPALASLADAQEFQYEQNWSHNENLLSSAESNCQKALSVDSTYAQAWAILGAVELLRKNQARAIELFDRALEYDQANKIALTRLGALYADSAPARAVTYFARAEQVDPTDGDIVNNLGVGYAKMKNYPAAVKAFRRSIELKPADAGLWVNLGYLYERVGNDDSARASYLTALRIDPSEEAVYESLAPFLLAKGEYVLAESVFVEGTRRRSGDPRILYALGLDYRAQGKDAQAVQAFTQGLMVVKERIKAGEDPSKSYAQEGLFDARLGDVSRAHLAAVRALQIDSSNHEVVFAVARIHAALGEADIMLRFFKHAKEMSPEYDAAFLATALDFERFRNDPSLLAVASKK